jgi:hypothetical protein
MPTHPLKKWSTEFAKLLEKTFSGTITPEETIAIISSYLQEDGVSLAPHLKNQNPGSKAFKEMLKSILEDTHSSDECVKEYLANAIQAYLEHDEQSLERYINESGSGSALFKEKAEMVAADGTIVLGIPGSVKHTAIKEKRAKERMSIPGDWSLYTCQSIHNRDSPKKEKHDGIINWVRVTLPENDPPLFKPRKNDIKTPIGWVRASDHLAFSNDAIRKYVFNDNYPNGVDQPGEHQQLPAFKRMDLITPARYDWVRFAPLAIFIAYEEWESTTPLFYILEAGNALGQPKVMYASSPNLDTPILMESGYKPTPFSSPENFYLSKVEFDKMDPIHVSIKVYTEEEIEAGVDKFHFHIDLALERTSLEQVASVDNFIPPAKQLLDAFLRIVELEFRGVPVVKSTLLEDRITLLKQKITKRASAGKNVKALERRLARLEEDHKQTPREDIQALLQDLKDQGLTANLLEKLKHHGKNNSDTLKDELDQRKHPFIAPGTHKKWENQLANQVVEPLHLYKPTSLNDVVNILKRAVATGNTVKAAGSGHSYSDVATTPDFFVDTHGLNAPSSLKNRLPGQLSQDMLRSTLPLGTHKIAFPDNNPADPKDREKNLALIEVEAGIKIADLNEKVLYERNLGLQNMGGYDGQTMMGAISTSTHGSGITLPPFPDMLRSLVLATTGKWDGTTISGNKDGDEGVYLYRIEPSDGITDPAKYNDPSIQLIQDDDCFNSVICSMGCMGIVYSIVLEVMEMYWLEETREITTLDQVFKSLDSADGSVPDILNQYRNFEILVHPYPMDEHNKVIEMDPTLPPETYYPYFKCLLTKRNIAQDPGKPFHRKGHRQALTQFMSHFGISFEITAALINAIPILTPDIVTLALHGLTDEGYVNKYWHIYNLGLEGNAGFATEIGFSLENEEGKYTSDNFKAAVNKIHLVAQNARLNGEQYQSSPFSLRFVKESNAHLSMMQGTNTCMIEMDMVTGTYGGMEVMMRYQNNMYDLGGRPHWGLEFDHLSGSNNLIADMYPKLDNWLAVYNQFNAVGTFNNRFTDRVGFTKHNFVRPKK